MAGLENARDIFELPRECVELLLSAGLAEGLERGRLGPAGLIDVAVAGGLAELRPRPMTLRDWLDELDRDGEIAGLAPAEREVLIEESAAWPGRHPAVEAWSEGTALYRDAVVETPSGEGTEEAFWARMEERREAWALTMLRAAYVLKSGGDGDWRSFAATAMALLDGRTLKTVPIMDRIYAETLLAMLRENVGRLSAGDDGTAELARLIAAAAWPEDCNPPAPSIWLDGYLAAGVLAPSEAGPDALYAAGVDRFPDGGGLGPEAYMAHMTKRYDALRVQYGETHAVAAMMLAADDIGMTEWAQGFAQGVRILEGAWPTDRFVHEERRMVSLLARLAEGELSDLDVCADVLTFIQWRQIRVREGRGIPRGRRDRDPARLRFADIPDGAANARSLERCGSAGPSDRAGSRGQDRALVKVLDGQRAGKTQRQIAEDIYGAAEVAAKWHPDGWMRSQVRRWIPMARPRRRRLARSCAASCARRVTGIWRESCRGRQATTFRRSKAGAARRVADRLKNQRFGSVNRTR